MRLRDDNSRIVDMTEQEAVDLESFAGMVLDGGATADSPLYNLSLDLYREWSVTSGGSLYHFCTMAFVSVAESRTAQSRQRQITVPDPVIKIAIDIGGVLSKYPDILKPLIKILRGVAGVQVLILTDMKRDKALTMLSDNGVDIDPEDVHSADYDTHGEACKAVLCAELGVHMLIDDHLGYVCIPGDPPLRLLVQPDASLPYYHPTWKTGSDSGSFGRVVSKSVLKHGDRYTKDTPRSSTMPKS